jgi:RNA polymerase sigma factor (sigma-70 family)
VCTSAYVHLEYKSLFIAESSPLEEYEAGSGPIEWTDDEIAAIRVVLQKVTALRIMNATDAEDLVQDTLLTMITKCPGNELEKGLLIWSMGILRKKVGNYYRRAQRYSMLKEQEIDTRHLTQHSTLTVSPEKKVVHEELRALVEKTLARLPPSQREVMELLIAGFDAGEIAQQLSPERYQNVINRLYRGRKKLAKELAKYGYGPESRIGMARNRLRSNRVKKEKSNL